MLGEGGLSNHSAQSYRNMQILRGSTCGGSHRQKVIKERLLEIKANRRKRGVRNESWGQGCHTEGLNETEHGGGEIPDENYMSLQASVISHLWTKRKWVIDDQCEDTREGSAHRIPTLSEEVREAQAPELSLLRRSQLSEFLQFLCFHKQRHCFSSGSTLNP